MLLKKVQAVGGSPDYNSLVSWEVGRRGNLPAGGVDGIPGGVREIAEVYSGGGGVGSVTLQNGWTSDVNCYPIVRAAVGHECGGKFDTTKAYANSIRSYVNYTRFGPGLSLDTMRFDNATGVLGERCVVKSGSITITFYTCGTVELRNCIAYGNRIAVESMYCTSSTFYNNTLCATGSNPLGCFYFVDNVARHYYCDNNYLYCGTGPAYFTTGSVILHKGANDATSNTEATTVALQSIAYSNANFVNVAVNSEDLHLTVASALRMKGATIPSVTNDIDGDSRLGLLYDIGADQQSDVPVCWNYTAQYKNSSRLFKASGCGCFPRALRVPGNVDASTGRMVDDGVLINPDEYRIL